MLPRRCLSGNGGTIQAGYSKVNAVCNHTKSWNLLRTGLGLGLENVSTDVCISYYLIYVYITYSPYVIKYVRW